MVEPGLMKPKKPTWIGTGGVLPEKKRIFCLTLFWYSPTNVSFVMFTGF